MAMVTKTDKRHYSGSFKEFLETSGEGNVNFFAPLSNYTILAIWFDVTLVLSDKRLFLKGFCFL